MIRSDGLGGCGLTSDGFANLWASARATWGVNKGKYFFEVKVESNQEVELEDTEEHPHALRYASSYGGVKVVAPGGSVFHWGQSSLGTRK